jgi:hypothetical protein
MNGEACPASINILTVRMGERMSAEESRNAGGVGRRHSEESRKKMSEAKKGKKMPKRKAATAEQRRNISESLKMKWRDPEYRGRVSAAIREGLEKKKIRTDAEKSGQTEPKDWQI